MLDSKRFLAKMTTDNISTVRFAILSSLMIRGLSVRVAVLVLMALSDVMIPDHNPGDDVLRFDLRLKMSSSSDCFCQQGFACDPEWKSYNGGERGCADIQPSTQQQSAIWSNLLLSPLTKWDSARFLTLAVDPKRRYPCAQCDDPFLDSEQSHAFFPLFPQLIQYVGLCLTSLVPRALLPPTFEAVLVLSALLINTLSFVVALISLTDLTLRLTLHQKYDDTKAIQVTGAVATMFILNPASIFFSASYSESIFSMLTFSGYALYYTPKFWFVAILPWMAASYTRSNGCLISAWLLLQAIASLLQTNRSVLRRLGSVTWHLLLSAAIVIPILLHDRKGDMLHCNQGDPSPEWCGNSDSGSLYSYVQRKHWNVGFLRYYELKQIPNFLLATPIFICSTLGVTTWIKTSWKERGLDRGNTSFPDRVVRWAFWALRRSNKDGNAQPTNLLHNPNMLSHYAVLAAAALLGLTIAHVQITTRMICSTCPAIYWQLAHLCLETPLRRLILVYLGSYLLIGTILHVNFLPWT